MGTSRALGLPLLLKELIEQSAAKRTYVIRTVYAVLLFGFALLIFWGEVYSDSTSPLDLLGQGRQMFVILFVLQMAGVLLFTPALTCGSVTIEKERNTFGLLLLTKLGPWTILAEKYLGRLVMMFTYLLISLPMFGFCYALGGIEQKDVWGGFFALVATVMQLAAIGLCCSCFFRTTVAAFIGTYAVTFLVLFGPSIAEAMIGRGLWKPVLWFFGVVMHSWVTMMGHLGNIALAGFFMLVHSESVEALPQLPTWSPMELDRSGVPPLFAPALVMEAIEGPVRGAPLWNVLARSVPALSSAGFFFVLSRIFLVRRAFASPKRYVYALFQALDRLFHRLNDRYTKGIILVGDKTHLPETDPIAWRETTKTSLGTFRYLVRMFVALEFPVAFICLLVIMLSNSYSTRHELLSVLVVLTWIIAVLLVTVRAATLVSKERSHETLDVLLSTPITSAEFVRQKFRGVVRMMIVVAIPLLTANMTQAWWAGLGWDSAEFVWRSGGRQGGDPFAIMYLLIACSCVALYLPLVAWMSFYIGLRMKTQTRAIFTSLAIIVAWIGLPLIVLISIFEALHMRPGSTAGMLLLVSPATLPAFSEANELDNLGGDPFLLFVLNTVFYAAIALFLRWRCLTQAAQLLGRLEDDPLWRRPVGLSDRDRSNPQPRAFQRLNDDLE